MKSSFSPVRRVYILTLLLLFTGALMSPASAQALHTIEKAFSKGDVSTIGTYLSPKVEYCYMDNTDVLPASVILDKLSEFFKDSPPTSYTRKHEGHSKNDESKYAIGILNTTTRPYRLYLYLEKSNGGEELREIRIDNPR